MAKKDELRDLEIKMISFLGSVNDSLEKASTNFQTLNTNLEIAARSLGDRGPDGLVGNLQILKDSIKKIVSEISNINVPANGMGNSGGLTPSPYDFIISFPPVTPPPIQPPVIPPPLPPPPPPPEPPTNKLERILDNYFQGNSDDNGLNYFTGQIILQAFTELQKVTTMFFDGVSNLIPSIDSLSIVTNLLDKVSSNIAELPNKIISLNQNLLGMGTNIQDFKDQVGFMTNELAGSTAQNLQNAATLYSQGFRGNNKSLLELAAIMDLTGQRTSTLTNDFTRMSTVMGLTNRQMNVLAEVVRQSSDDYKVKSDELIEALGKVQNQNVMATAGFGATFMRSLTPLLGEFKRNSTEIVGLVNALTKTDTLLKLAPIDPQITSLARRMERAGSAEELKSILIQITGRLSSFAQMMAGQAGAAGSAGSLPTTAILADILNSIGMPLADATQLFRALTGQLDEYTIKLQQSQQVQDSYAAATQKLANAALPFITSLVNMATSIINFIGGGGGFVILFGSLLFLAKSFVSQAVSIATTTLSLYQLRLQILSMTVLTNVNNASLRQSIISLVSFASTASFWAGVLSFGLTAILGVIGGIAAWSAMDSDSTELNTDAISKNTAALQNNSDIRFKDATAQNIFLDTMNRNIAFVLTRESAVQDALKQMVSQGQVQQDQMKALINTAMAQYMATQNLGATRPAVGP